jgi:hypothetical protein
LEAVILKQRRHPFRACEVGKGVKSKAGLETESRSHARRTPPYEGLAST